MKTKTLFFLIFSVMSICAQSQSFYVRAGLGAAICTAPHMLYQSTDINSGRTQHTEDAIRGGLGDGLPFVAAAGYYFGKNFGIELGVDYFLGFSHKTVNNYTGSMNTVKLKGSMLAFVPAFIMKINMDKIKPYARLGIMIGAVNSATNSSELTGTNTGSYIAKDYGGIAIGAQAAVGAEFPLSKLISFFGEVNLDGISWAPKKGKYTKATYNGVDQLADMNTKDKTWVYVKKLDETQTISDSDPNKYSSINYSFANAGLIVGVKINFGK
jgi:hypothetical protein